MAKIGFLVFLGFVISGLWVALEIFSYGSTKGWPMIGSMALAIPVSGVIIFIGVLVNGAIGKLSGGS
ncbi:hypothetical protein OIU35_31460 [Boseaceae bacterium BT-24-1]|nr:hypothetical protein [Boseaceae bacterium BT-24-1]